MKITLLALLLAGACREPAIPPPNGAELYRENGCAACHGAEGRGDGMSARGTNLHPRDLVDPVSYRNGAGVEEIAQTIATGFQSMPAFAHIPPDERRAIAEFIVARQKKEKR